MNDTIAVKLEGARPAQSPTPSQTQQQQTTPALQQQPQQSSPPPPPAPFAWSLSDELLLCELLQRALASPSNALPSPTIRMELRQIVDWSVLAAQLQSKSSTANADTANAMEKLDEAKCAAKFQSMLLESRAQQAAQAAAASGTPLQPMPQTLGQVSPAELQPFLTASQSRLTLARLTQMQRDMEACTLKMNAMESAITTEQARQAAQNEERQKAAAAAAAAAQQAQAQAAEMQRQKQEQDSKAALQQQAGMVDVADGSAAASASSGTSVCPACSVPMHATGPNGSLECTNARCARSKGHVTVKLEPMSSSSSASAARNMMSPAASSSSVAAAASSDVRPSPLVIPSPSASSMPRVVDWPNSALHAPLKTGSLSRANTGSGAAAASPLQPPMGRQLSVGGSDSGAAPHTPSSSPYPSPSAPAVPLTDERLREIYLAILDTLVSREEADIFLEPVTEEVATGYFDVIKNPMSFRDVRNMVEAAAAGTAATPSPVEFWNAIQLIYANCYQYNDKKTPFFKQGKTMEAVTLDLFKQSLSHLSAVPWNPAGGRKQTGRPPKYTLNTPSSSAAPSTPSLTSSSSYTAASSPLPTPGGSLAAQFSAMGPVTPAAAAVPTPSTPTRKGASGPSSSASSSAPSSALPPVEEETVSLSKSSSRRTSVTQGGAASSGTASNAAASARKAARVNVGISGVVDPEGDDTMDGGELTLAAASAGAPSVTAASSSGASLSAPASSDNASEAAESESVGDDGTGGHDNATATPGRGSGGGRGGGVAGRKRNANALAPASATTAGSSAASAAAGASTPSSAASARKTGAGRRGGEPSTPVSGAAAAALTPAGLSLNSATTPAATEDETSAEVAASGQKKRGRWATKAK